MGSMMPTRSHVQELSFYTEDGEYRCVPEVTGGPRRSQAVPGSLVTRLSSGRSSCHDVLIPR